MKNHLGRAGMTQSDIRQQRPLSPHLFIYKPQITSVLSIIHRATGVLLSFGALGIALWLWGLAYSPELYDWLVGLFSGSDKGFRLAHLVLMLWSACFYYHLANGIRHLFWDIGKGYALPNATRSGWFVIGFTLIATAFTWLVVYGKIDLA